VTLSPATFYDDNGVVRLQGMLDGGGGVQTVLTTTLTLSAADVGTLRNSSVAIVAAPGAGKIVLPVRAAGVYLAGATPYENQVNAKMQLGPGSHPNNSGYAMLSNSVVGPIFSSATDQAFFLGHDPLTQTAFISGSGAWDAPGQFEDLPLCVYLDGATLGETGDGTCKLWLSYVIADLA
jgi:hypothetical protein